MPFIKYFIWAVLFSGILLPAEAQDQTPQQLVSTVQSALVEVRAIDSKSFDQGNGQIKVGSYQAQGAGVIIDPNGLIVTNTHILAGASRILVGLSDGTILEAHIVYSSDADFSFIKIEPSYSLTSIRWADSSQTKIGDPVIALTNTPDGQHVLGGAITNLINNAASNNIDLIELNLNLVHGDSGGPLLDEQGNLLGLIMGKTNSEDNKSYAIASNKIQQEYRQYRD